MNSLEKHTYTIDELIDIINLSADDNLVFEEPIKKNIKENYKKIIDELIENDFVELFGKIKKIFKTFSKSDFNKLLEYFINSLENKLQNLDLSSIEWLIKNEKIFFFESIKKMSLVNFITILKSNNFIQIDKLIKSEDVINIQIYERKIIMYLDNCVMNFYSVFDSYEKIIILVDTYLNYKVNFSVSDITHFHCRIFHYMLQINTTLGVIIKYKKRYKVSDKVLKEYFEKGDKFTFYISSMSLSTDVISWFFEIVSVLDVIKSYNYKDIFNKVCQSGDLESTKLVYNLIQCAGFKIDKCLMNSILYELIVKDRWGNTKDKFGNKIEYSKIIHELINIGAKPPKGTSIYTDYYNNIIMIKK